MIIILTIMVMIMGMMIIGDNDDDWRRLAMIDDGLSWRQFIEFMQISIMLHCVA